MFEFRRNLFKRISQELRDTLLPELAILLGRWFPIEMISETEASRDRVFTPWRTLILFVYQALTGNASCSDIVQKAIAWLEPLKGKKISTNTSAYSQARKRLPSEFLYEFGDRLTRQVPVPETFHGHLVKVVDGTGLSMPDTPENRRAFPPQKGDRSGFPTLKVVGMFSLAIGTILDWGAGNGPTSDLALFRSLWPSLQSRDLILGDRIFCSYVEFYYLQTRGIMILTRKNVWRKRQRTVKCLGPNDLIVEWDKPSHAPEWLTKEEWAAIPSTVKIREVTFAVNNPGFRTREITIVTTLLDESIPGSDLAELYRKRWCVELFLRDIKISMGMDILKCKTPEMIEKEVHVFLLVYNLIRLIMLEAASEHGLSPHQISFTATIAAIKEWGPRLAGVRTEKDGKFLIEQFSRVVASRRLRNRRDRVEPRALKRRMKKYQLLKGNRHQFKEIPHCYT